MLTKLTPMLLLFIVLTPNVSTAMNRWEMAKLVYAAWPKAAALFTVTHAAASTYVRRHDPDIRCFARLRALKTTEDFLTFLQWCQDHRIALSEGEFLRQERAASIRQAAEAAAASAQEEAESRDDDDAEGDSEWGELTEKERRLLEAVNGPRNH